MNEATKQALLSALRSLLIIAGTSLASKGVIAAGNVEILAGVIVTVIPIAWGIAEKYLAERKAQAREVAAVNAGIAVANSGTVGDTARPADVPAIIKEFAPTA